MKEKEKRKPIKEILVDMDAIMVDMLPEWLNQYSSIVYDRYKEVDVVPEQIITDFNAHGFCKYPDVLQEVMESEHFFANLPAIPGAIPFLRKIMDMGVHVVILTQAPAEADFAVRDKKRWLRKHIPDFNMRRIIFAHEKYRVDADVLFDDSPVHLIAWKKRHPEGTTVKIEYLYNKDTKSDLTFNKITAWASFHNLIRVRNSI